ncbi:hypothetical protein [Actinomadura sp. DC4]|uniref:hypothetical protein n=1 Tax=Actinomadura sp. DC4 TaxID=3055069 RepID=UPI0025B196EE|nr:hypothetical protein [Actinomadura sp. DC4]MDN3358614.1 hypothetical protein [Actinomadura sp. DC4]
MTEDRFAHCLPALRELGLLPGTALAAFVVGSTVRGWDHGASDLDLVVVCSERFRDDRLVRVTVPLSPGEVDAIGFMRDGRRWEVKYWLDDQVDQVLDKVSRDSFDQDRTAGARLVPTEELLLGRLPTCHPLSGLPWVLRRRRQVEESAYQAYVLTDMLTAADTKAETAMGQLAAGDLPSAVLSARDAFGCAIDALLVGHGEYGALTKWRARRFQAAKPDLLTFEEYWEIETMRGYDPADPAQWVEQVVTLCKDIAMEVEIP